MKNKTLFVVAFVVVFFLSYTIYLQYVVGMHGSCPKCESVEEDLNALSDKLHSLYIDLPPVASLSDELSFVGIDDVELVDPWGNEYLYSSFSKNGFQCIVVWSFGADGSPGGTVKPELDVFKIEQCRKLKKVTKKKRNSEDSLPNY